MKIAYQFLCMNLICLAAMNLNASDVVDKYRKTLFEKKVAERFHGTQLGNAAQEFLSQNQPICEATEHEIKFFTGLYVLGVSLVELALQPSKEALLQKIREKAALCTSKSASRVQVAYADVLNNLNTQEIQQQIVLIRLHPQEAQGLQEINDEVARKANLRDRIRLLRAQKR